MLLIRRPWVWAARVRHRRGYGVHSPWAFAFITGVVYERAAYYAYAGVGGLHPWWVRWLRLYPLQCRRLLFRLANFAHPRRMAVVGERPVERQCMALAVPSASWGLEGAGLVFVAWEHVGEAEALAAVMPTDGMLIVEGIHRDDHALACWRAVQKAAHTGVTFDLHTYGVAFFDPRLHKQHYVVNF